MFGRKRVAALVAEFLGTGILTLVYLSVQRTNIGIPFFVGIGAGVAVAIAVYFFGENTQVHLNPAITLAVMTARKINWLLGVMYVVVQLLGAWAAYGIYHYFVSTSMPVIGGHYSARILFAEAIGTLILALAWGAAYFRRFETTNRALVLGASYTLAVVVAGAVGTNFGIANPAVALGIRAWNIWGSMGWGTYVAGPVLGAVIGANLYALLFSRGEGEEVVASETLIVAESVVPAASTTRAGRSTTTKKNGTKKTTAKKTSKATASKRRR